MPKDLRAGFPVHWQQLSDGPAPALLLHCALAFSGAYTILARALARDLAIVAPDMPGHGQSGDWDQRCDLHDQTTAIAASFLTPGMHVIGHSFGATVALRLAQEHPYKIASLTLIEPVLFAAARDEDPAAFDEHWRGKAPFAAALAVEDWERAARLFTDKWGDGRGWDTLPERQRQAFVARIPLIGETDDCLNHDRCGLLAPGRLEAVRAPTVLVRGERTMPIIAPIQRALARRIPDAHEVVVPDASHMLPLSHPGPVSEAVRSVMAR